MVGIGASPGIAIGKVIKLNKKSPELVEKSTLSVLEELKRYEDGENLAVKQVQNIREISKKKLGEEEAKIFDAHLEIISDIELKESVNEEISTGLTAEYSVKVVTDRFIEMFLMMDDKYLKERSADIKDVADRLINGILGVNIKNPFEGEGPFIIVGNDLTPSDTVLLDPKVVKGFLTEIGGQTSHSAIMARTMGIPAVVGAGNDVLDICSGELLLIDGTTGKWELNPTEDAIGSAKKAIELELENKKALRSWIGKESVTKDGFKVELACNIGSPNDLEMVIENDGEGVGLFRSEFLYMDQSDWPSEELQYEAYGKVLRGMKGKPVIIRTLDIGGDKELPYFDQVLELNPFLGNRAIRLCLKKPEIFRTQIRALLRANEYGNLKIMIPMISSLEELRSAKAEIEYAKEELRVKKVLFNEDLEIGIMVEIPSVAVCADIFAKEVDFFSIGTNDLTQYTLACDRINAEVSHLYSHYHPAVLALIANVAKAGRSCDIMVGMCGEAAGDTLLQPFLIGVGLDELSMSPQSILKTRSSISELTKEFCEDIVSKVLSMGTAKEVKEYLEKVSSQL